MALSVASVLVEQGVPIIFVAGSSVIPKELAESPVMQKPVDFRALLKLTAQMCNSRCSVQVALAAAQARPPDAS